MDVPGRSGSVSIDVESNYGAIVVGDHNVVQLSVAARPVVTPVTPAAVHRPRPPRPFVDRRVETLTLQALLEQAAVVQVRGPTGIGKSAFAHHAAAQAAAAYAAGAVTLPPGLAGPRDALQALFEVFHATDAPYVPSPTRLREWLGTTQALVVLDAPRFEEGAPATLLDSARECRFIVAGGAALAGDVAPLELGPLPPGDALELAGHLAGSVPSGSEAAAWMARVREAGGHPRRLAELARTARLAGETSATQVARAEPERRLMQLVEDFAPHALPLACLAALSGQADAAERATRLAAAGVLRLEPGPAGSDTEALAVAWPTPPPPGGAGVADRGGADAAADDSAGPRRHRCEAALGRLGRAARGDAAQRRHALAALPLLWTHLSAAREAGDAAAVMTLARSWDAPLALAGRWDAWGALLQQHLQAARDAGDPAAQAWALHQGGTRELALGHYAAARTAFEQALVLEVQLGDAALQAATRLHLDALRGLGVVSPGLLAPGWVVKGGVAALVLGGGTWWATTAPSRLVVEPDRLDFGALAVGESATRTVQLRNAGRRELAVPHLQLRGGDGAGAFAVVGSCVDKVLAGGASCGLDVRFAPTARGAASATLAASTPDQVATVLEGAGLAGELAAPTALDFGEVPLAGPAASAQLTLRNVGERALRVGIVASPARPFTLVADACSATPVPSGGRCELTLAFSPGAEGRATARLRLRSDAPGTAEHEVALQGSGVQGRLEAQPARLDFGEQAVGTISEPRTVELVNAGSAALRADSMRIVPASAPFEIDAAGCGAAGLPVAGRCTLALRFRPRPGQVGPQRAQLLVRLDGAAPLRVPLGGMATRAVVEPQPAQLVFAPVPWPGKTSTASATLTLTNTGDAPLTEAAARVSGPSQRDFSLVNGCTAALAPGAQCRIVVRYRPRALGYSAAQLELRAPGAEGVLDVPLIARALPTMPAPQLLRPADGEAHTCDDKSKVLRFSWQAVPAAIQRPVRYRLVLDSGETAATTDQTEATLRVDCFQPVRQWRVEASGEHGFGVGVSAARELRTTIKSSSTPPPSPAPAPAPPAPQPPAPSPTTPTGALASRFALTAPPWRPAPPSPTPVPRTEPAPGTRADQESWT